MKRAKIGDVFAFKTDRGYRIIQWVYNIPKFGKYVKVFESFYNNKPDDLIIHLQQKSYYIIVFDIHQLVKNDILEYWGNYASCIIEPFPQYDISFRRYGSQMLFRISNSMRHQEDEQYIGDSSGSIIPEKYKDVRMLNCMPHPIIFLHLLSSDFDLKHFNLFWMTDEEEKILKQKYPFLV